MQLCSRSPRARPQLRMRAMSCRSQKTGIRITAAGAAGAFYALQTLFQLLPPEFEHAAPVYGVAWEVPCVRIQDAPRFSWRGCTWMSEGISSERNSWKSISISSRVTSSNVFHWHLTEDQGWRIEIKKYPKLTTVGSWRKETMGDGQPHGGFYTQDEIREVVAYARNRFVTIVPEIEMPGHSTAALASYPELSLYRGAVRGPDKVAGVRRRLLRRERKDVRVPPGCPDRSDGPLSGRVRDTSAETSAPRRAGRSARSARPA